MRIVSDTLKEILKEPAKQRKGRILVDENYYDVYNLEYYADSYADGNVVGNAIASQLDFDLPYMEKFDSFKYFDGIWTGEDYEYVDFGTFYVFDEQNQDEFNKHITAFDSLIKFNTPFVDVGVYPKTLYAELQNICSQAGVELENMEIVNGDFIIENNQFMNGETLKVVLKAICQVSGTYAVIKNDKVVLQLQNMTDEEIVKSQHEPITWKRKSYEINQVVLGMADIEGEHVLMEDENDIALNGVHKLVINNNPFAYTQEKREQLIEQLFNQVKGFGYVPYEMKGEWLSYLEIGDRIKIDGNDTIVLRISGKSPKGLESEMSAPAIIDSAVNYARNVNSLIDRVRHAEYIVNKNNGTITQLTKQVDTIQDDISKNFYTIEQSNTLIQNATNGLVNTLNTTGGNNILRNPIGIFNYDYWEGEGATPYTDTYIQNKTGQRSCWLLNNGTHKQTIQVKNGTYTFSMLFEKLISLSNVILKINDVEYELTNETIITFEVTDNHITIEFVGDIDMCAYLMNLMLNEGNIPQVYSNNSNETISDTVMIGKGIQIRATGVNTELDAQADGIRIKNINTNQTTTEFTDKGTTTNELNTNKATIAKVLINDTGTQTLFTRL